MTTTGEIDVAVVGGGLSGLTTALCLARRGLRVTVFERAGQLGGRARTVDDGSYRFNLGPHAWCRNGPGAAVLTDLGIPVHGVSPRLSAWRMVREGRAHGFPGGAASLLTTGVLGVRGKRQLAGVLMGLGRLDTRTLAGMTVEAWVSGAVSDPRAREVLHALVRLATYVHDPSHLSASAAVARLRVTTGGVLYLHGGWRTLVDALAAAAQRAGVTVHTGAPIVAIDGADGVDAMRDAAGRAHRVRAAVLATPPSVVGDLLRGSGAAWPASWPLPRAVTAAVLDLALRRLPRPSSTLALGCDRPTYAALQSAARDMAPTDGAAVQAMRYLESGRRSGGADDERELEALMDVFQPGWREVVVSRRFLPGLVVSHGSVTGVAGEADRPGPTVPGVRGLYVAGDWVGPSGMLADAAVSSAGLAATQLLADLASRTRRASPPPGVSARPATAGV